MAPVDDSSDDEEQKASDSEREAPAEEPAAAAPPPDDAAEEEDDLEDEEPDEDGWVNLMEGKIRKRVLKEGTGAQPEMKQDVRCNIEVRLADSTGKAAEPKLLQRYESWRYRIGEGEAVPALELGLRHMKEGEECEIFGAPNMAWGPRGLRAASDAEGPVPPDAAVVLRVTLLENMFSEGAAPTEWNQLIQDVTWRKTNGNDFFKRQEYNKAIRSYGAGVELFSNNGFEPPEHLQGTDREAARAAAMSIVTDCGANLAEAHLQLGNAMAAKEAAEVVVEMCPKHVKGLYRLARARLQLDDFTGCEEAIKTGLEVEKGNPALLKVEAELRQKERKYEAKSKRLAGKVFQGLDYPNATEEKLKKRAELAAEDTWARWAKESFKEWFDWRILAAMVVAAIALAILLALLPKRQWPFVLIFFVMVVPAGIGFLMADKEAKEEKEQAGGKEKKKQQ